MRIEDQIKTHLDERLLQAYPEWFCQNSVPSTNTYLQERLEHLKNGAICLAQHQSAGKGSRGRRWLSEDKQGIYLSIAYEKKRFASLAGLSCAIGIALYNALVAIGVPPKNLRLKWPNDVWLDNKKLAGILVEVFSTHVIVGMGVNLCSPKSADFAGIGLDVIGNTSPETLKVPLIVELLSELHRLLQSFEISGFLPFADTFNAISLLSDRNFTCQINNQTFNAVDGTVLCDGSLQITDKMGNKAICYSGDVRLIL